jgi:hypothetical protein
MAMCSRNENLIHQATQTRVGQYFLEPIDRERSTMIKKGIGVFTALTLVSSAVAYAGSAPK